MFHIMYGAVELITIVSFDYLQDYVFVCEIPSCLRTWNQIIEASKSNVNTEELLRIFTEQLCKIIASIADETNKDAFKVLLFGKNWYIFMIF